MGVPISLEAVSVGHGDQPAVLERVSLDVPAGGILVLLGPSGCGKSSLLDVLAGFSPARAGVVRVGGRPVTGPGADRGVVFQDDALLPWLDVQGNVAFPLRLKGLAPDERAERACHVLGLVGLAGQERRKVWELSGGMRQRVGIARALAADPDVLLMDEPFGALDALTRERMQELLLRVWRTTGKTLVVVTHDVEEAVFLATDLVLLSRHPGRIVRHLPLGFGRRHADGERARAVKSSPAFVDVREEVLSAVLAQEPEPA